MVARGTQTERGGARARVQSVLQTRDELKAADCNVDYSSNDGGSCHVPDDDASHNGSEGRSHHTAEDSSQDPCYCTSTPDPVTPPLNSAFEMWARWSASGSDTDSQPGSDDGAERVVMPSVREIGPRAKIIARTTAHSQVQDGVKASLAATPVPTSTAPAVVSPVRPLSPLASLQPLTPINPAEALGPAARLVSKTVIESSVSVKSPVRPVGPPTPLGTFSVEFAVGDGYNPEVKSDVKPEAESEEKPMNKPKDKPESKVEAKFEEQPEVMPLASPVTAPANKAAPAVDAKPDRSGTKPDTQPDTASAISSDATSEAGSDTTEDKDEAASDTYSNASDVSDASETSDPTSKPATPRLPPPGSRQWSAGEMVLRNPDLAKCILKHCNYPTWLAVRGVCTAVGWFVNGLLFEEVTLRLDDTLSVVPRQYFRSLPLLPIWCDAKGGPGAHYDNWEQALNAWQNVLRKTRVLTIYARNGWNPKSKLGKALDSILQVMVPEVCFDMRGKLFPYGFPRAYYTLGYDPTLRTYAMRSWGKPVFTTYLTADAYGPVVPKDVISVVESIAPLCPSTSYPDDGGVDLVLINDTKFKLACEESLDHSLQNFAAASLKRFTAALQSLLHQPHVNLVFVGWEWLIPAEGSHAEPPTMSMDAAEEHELPHSVWLVLKSWLHSHDPSSHGCCTKRMNRIKAYTYEQWLTKNASNKAIDIIRHPTPQIEGPDWIWMLPKRTKHPLSGVIKLKQYRSGRPLDVWPVDSAYCYSPSISPASSKSD